MLLGEEMQKIGYQMQKKHEYQPEVFQHLVRLSFFMENDTIPYMDTSELWLMTWEVNSS